MSLRDQLLKSGLANKKQVDKANRALRKKRKKDQSDKDRKTAVASREAEAQKRRTKKRTQEVQERRKTAEIRQEQTNRARLVSNLIRSYGKSIPEGRQVFFHRRPDGKQLARLYLPIEFALELRAGRQGIGWTGSKDEPRFLTLPAEVVRRILSHDPARIVFFNDQPPDSSDAADRLSGFERLPDERNRARIRNGSSGHTPPQERQASGVPDTSD